MMEGTGGGRGARWICVTLSQRTGRTAPRCKGDLGDELSSVTRAPPWVLTVGRLCMGQGHVGNLCLPLSFAVTLKLP